MSSFSRQNPFNATIQKRFCLSKIGSTKSTYHLSLSLAGSALSFEPGDSLAIFPQNDPILVERLLEGLQVAGSEEIVDKRSGNTLSIREFFLFKVNLSRVTSSLLKFLLEHTPEGTLKSRLSELLQEENKPLLSQYLQTHEPLDILKESHEKLPLENISQYFSPLLPRFYSIASSQKVSADTVDLTVALSTFNHAGETRFGVASHFLCHLAEVDSTPVPLYVHPSLHFRLPEDPTCPIILIGPGTGVAPFRAFLQERIATQAPGKNWLFFGERHKAFDFFYEEFWQSLVSQGRLRLDLAFSRDQEERIYVQHKLYESARDLWRWIAEGAYVYVCGDAEKMAKDVEAMLQKIIAEQSGLSPEASKAYLKQMRQEKRYLLDVY